MKRLALHIPQLLNTLFKYSLGALLVFIPLYPKFPILNVPFTYIAIRAEDFLIVFVWLVFISKIISERKIKLPKITFQVSTFLAIGAVSTLSAILITKNIQPTISVLHFLRRVEYISIMFLVYYSAKAKNNRHFLFQMLLIPAIGVFLYGIAQIYFQAPVISTMDSESSKGIALTLRPGVTLNSTFAGHYDLAAYLTMMMTLTFSLVCSKKKLRKAIPFAILFVALLWMFMQAGSRISLLGLFVSIGLVAHLYKKHLLGVIFYMIILSLIATSPQYIGRFKTLFSVFSSKMSSISISRVIAVEDIRAIQQDTSTSIRFDVEWPRALRSFYKNPLLGTGYSSISLATDNDYLRAIGETGILGLLSFISLLIALFQSLRKKIKVNIGRDKVIAISSMGILVAFLVTALFLDVFESSKIAMIFWAFMGLALSTKS